MLGLKNLGPNGPLLLFFVVIINVLIESLKFPERVRNEGPYILKEF